MIGKPYVDMDSVGTTDDPIDLFTNWDGSEADGEADSEADSLPCVYVNNVIRPTLSNGVQTAAMWCLVMITFCIPIATVAFVYAVLILTMPAR